MPETERERLEKLAREIGDILRQVIPADVTFAFILADVGPGGFFSYISNAEREGMVALLREAASKIEAETD